MHTEISINYSHHHLQNHVVFGSCPATSSEPSETSNIRGIIENIGMHNNNNSLYINVILCKS